MPFPKWKINTKMQWQVNVDVNKSIIYKLQRMKKRHPFTSYPAAKHQKKTRQVTDYKHKRKNSGLFYASKQVLTLAPTIVLLI